MQGRRKQGLLWVEGDALNSWGFAFKLCEHLHLAPRISILLGRSPIVLRVRRSGKSEWTGADGLLFSALSTDIRFWGEFGEYRVMGRCG